MPVGEQTDCIELSPVRIDDQPRFGYRGMMLDCSRHFFTVDFIKKVLNKVTLFGAIYLGIVAILPLIIGKAVNNAALSIGGTSVIIVVGVALETVQALESQMLMRQYKGFLE